MFEMLLNFFASSFHLVATPRAAAHASVPTGASTTHRGYIGVKVLPQLLDLVTKLGALALKRGFTPSKRTLSPSALCRLGFFSFGLL